MYLRGNVFSELPQLANLDMGHFHCERAYYLLASFYSAGGKESASCIFAISYPEKSNLIFH